MTVAVVSRAFVGGSLRRDELKATEIRRGVEQGPVPEHLLIELEDEEAPIVWRPRLPRSSRASFGCRSEEELREKSRIGAAKRQAKAKGYLWPCPKCGGSTRCKNRPNAPRRHCGKCKVTFRLEGEVLVPVTVRRVPGGPPCVHCGEDTASCGALYWRCKTCKRRVQKQAASAGL